MSSTLTAPGNDGVLTKMVDAEALYAAAWSFLRRSSRMYFTARVPGIEEPNAGGAIFEACTARNGEAVKAGVTLLPGCGFDVVPTDGLAAHLASRMPDAVALRLSTSFPSAPSTGTLATGAVQVARLHVCEGTARLSTCPYLRRGRVDFGRGMRATVGISWGDVSTALHSTRNSQHRRGV